MEDDDGDVGNTEFIKSIFSHNCELSEELQLSQRHYILHLAGVQNKINGNVAAASSNGNIDFFNLLDYKLGKLDSIKHPENVIGLSISKENDNLFYVGVVDGKIYLYDLREKAKNILQFKDTSLENGCRQLSCFDTSPNSKLIAAGTELYEGDAFILFWDARKTNLLGGYWESHRDDITQVKFHPEDSNKLSSGSTDGLINIYNLAETSEDEALIDSLNTESSVESILWYKEKSRDCVLSITHTSDIQLWKLDEPEIRKIFTRDDIAKAIQRKPSSHCYVASAYKDLHDNVYILAGSYWNDGECGRILKISNNELLPECMLLENKQIIRSCCYNSVSNTLITGGEKGLLNVWKLSS